jgi:AcrR family transcriptional regulator
MARVRKRPEGGSRRTRTRLIEVARELFAARGFARVAGEDLAARAGLTRGALYHQFDGKDGLFAAVHEQALEELTRRVEAAAQGAPEAWEGLRAACRALLEACLDPAVWRILVVDAPAVLGEPRPGPAPRRGPGPLGKPLRRAREAGILAPLPIDLVADLLAGAVHGAARWIEGAADPLAARSLAVAAVERALEGLRERP